MQKRICNFFKLTHFTPFLALAILLGGCESTREVMQAYSESRRSPPPTSETVAEAKRMDEAQYISRNRDSRRLSPVETIAGQQEQAFDLANRRNSGSIQVFPLDGQSTPPQRTGGLFRAERSRGFSGTVTGPEGRTDQNNPSIQVFSLSDGPDPANSARRRNLTGPMNIGDESLEQEGLRFRELPQDSRRAVLTRDFQRDSGARYILDSGVQGQIYDSFYFEHDKVELSADMIERIKRIGGELADQDLERVEVRGHASTVVRNRGPQISRIINLGVSLDRAEEVAVALIRGGLPAEKIRATGVGDAESPRKVPPGMSEEAASRRAQIVIRKAY